MSMMPRAFRDVATATAIVAPLLLGSPAWAHNEPSPGPFAEMGQLIKQVGYPVVFESGVNSRCQRETRASLLWGLVFNFRQVNFDKDCWVKKNAVHSHDPVLRAMGIKYLESANTPAPTIHHGRG